MEIRELILQGKTEEALEVLAKSTSEVILLKNRFNESLSAYESGHLKFSDWQREQGQINFKALVIAAKI